MPPRLFLFIFVALLGCGRSFALRHQEPQQTVQSKAVLGFSAAPVKQHAGVIHVGSGFPPPGVEDAKLIHHVRPIYPAWARKQRLQGSVEFQAIVNKDGRIRHLTFVRGPKALVLYAEAAIRQWKYRPMTMNGKPVEMPTRLVIGFTLNQ